MAQSPMRALAMIISVCRTAERISSATTATSMSSPDKRSAANGTISLHPSNTRQSPIQSPPWRASPARGEQVVSPSTTLPSSSVNVHVEHCLLLTPFNHHTRSRIQTTFHSNKFLAFPTPPASSSQQALPLATYPSITTPNKSSVHVHVHVPNTSRPQPPPPPHPKNSTPRKRYKSRPFAIPPPTLLSTPNPNPPPRPTHSPTPPNKSNNHQPKKPSSKKQTKPALVSQGRQHQLSPVSFGADASGACGLGADARRGVEGGVWKEEWMEGGFGLVLEEENLQRVFG